jgi:hypothetical protein
LGRNPYLATIETDIGFTGTDHLNSINMLFESDRLSEMLSPSSSFRFYCTVLAVETTAALIISDSLQYSPSITTRSDVADQMLVPSAMQPS